MSHYHDWVNENCGPEDADDDDSETEYDPRDDDPAELASRAASSERQSALDAAESREIEASGIDRESKHAAYLKFIHDFYYLCNGNPETYRHLLFARASADFAATPQEAAPMKEVITHDASKFHTGDTVAFKARRDDRDELLATVLKPMRGVLNVALPGGVMVAISIDDTVRLVERAA